MKCSCKSAEIEKWPILNTEIEYVEYNRKELQWNRVQLCPTEGKCKKRV